MEGRLEDPLPFARDQKFDNDLQKIKESDSRRAETIAKRCEAIRHDPFKGEWKKWAMDGLYGLHAKEMVILYELTPDLSPNNDPDDVEELYFWRVIHHDEQQTAVKNVDRIDFTQQVTVRFDYDCIPNAQKFASELYNSSIIEVEEDTYDSEGVTLEGTLIREDGEAELRSLLPKTAEIDVVAPEVTDVISEEHSGTGAE